MQKVLLLTFLTLASLSSVAHSQYKDFKDINLVKAPDYHFYVSAFGGYNFSDVTQLGGYNTTLDNGGVAGAALGISLYKHFRVEAEIGYRRNSTDNLEIKLFGINFSQPADGHFKSTDYMANVLYDVTFAARVQPYIGVGIGYAHNSLNFDVDQQGEFFSVNQDKNGFAWQAIAGVGFPLNDRFKIGIEYRYYNPTNCHYYSNNFLGTLRFKFA